MKNFTKKFSREDQNPGGVAITPPPWLQTLIEIAWLYASYLRFLGEIIITQRHTARPKMGDTKMGDTKAEKTGPRRQVQAVTLP